jgi:hypothetical protein
LENATLKPTSKKAGDELNNSTVRIVNDLIGRIGIDPHQPLDVHRESCLLAEFAEQAGADVFARF